MVETMDLRGWIDKAWRHAVALALPPACVLCGETLPATEPLGFCPSCYAKLPWWDKSGVLPPDLPCAVDAFFAPCLYDGVLRDAILRLKFRDGTQLAPTLAKLLLPLVPPGDALLVPVPMHRGAFRKRLYNQSALLARALGRLAGKPVDVRALIRLKPSDGQARRTRAQRLKLSSADFKAARVEGRHIVLVDDIYTTGATARACALALKSAGAEKVTVLALAYTPAG
jgi:ComF family protein